MPDGDEVNGDVLDGVDLPAEPGQAEDTTPAGEAQDTVQAEAGEDTVAAGEGEDATPAGEGDDTTPAGEGEEKPADTTPASTATDTTKPDTTDYAAKMTEAEQKYREAQARYNAANEAIEKLADDDFPTAKMMKELRAAERDMAKFSDDWATAKENTIAQQRQQTNQYWQNWSNQNKDINDGERVYSEIYQALATKYPGHDIRVAAMEQFNAKVAAIRAGRSARKPAIPPKPQPPVTKGGASIQPKGGGGRPPAPKPLTPEEKFIKDFGDASKEFLND